MLTLNMYEVSLVSLQGMLFCINNKCADASSTYLFLNTFLPSVLFTLIN